jgi:hypothetical protein
MDIRFISIFTSAFTALALLSTQPAVADHVTILDCLKSTFGKVCFKVTDNSKTITSIVTVHGKTYILPGASISTDGPGPHATVEHSWSPNGQGLIFMPAQVLGGMGPPIVNLWLIIDVKTGILYDVNGYTFSPGKILDYNRIKQEAKWVSKYPAVWALLAPDGSLSNPLRLP